VLGPEKLPRVVSEIGRWVGRARSMARQFREQLEEEVQLEQARKAQAPTTPAAAVPPVSAAASEAPVAPPDTFSHAHPTDATGADPSADERRT
jgi:sec-independent protein translocase protein TatB